MRENRSGWPAGCAGSPAGEGAGRAGEGQIVEADALQKAQTLADFL